MRTRFEVRALQPEAPERSLAMPLLVKSRMDVPSDPAKRTADDEEFLMATQDIVEAWRQEAIQQGRERATARSLIDVYEARFGAIPDDLRAIVDATHDELVLRSWLKLASTRAADELAATIRANRVG